MADEVIGLGLNIDPEGNIKKADQGLQGLNEQMGNVEQKATSFKAQLNAMTNQLLAMEQAGQKGTAAYDALLNKLADAKSMAGNLSQAIADINPDKRAKSFQILGETIVGGFQAATGAIAVFTGDNKELNEILLKSMAVIQGLQGLQALKDAKEKASALFNIGLKKQQVTASKAVAAGIEGETIATEGATAATEGLKGALIATGIGALVVLLGTLIANWGTVSKWIMKVVDNFGFLKVAVDKVRDALSFITGGLIDDSVTAAAKDAIDRLTEASKKLYEQNKGNKAINDQAIRQLELEGVGLAMVTEAKKKLIDAQINSNKAYTAGLEAKEKNKTITDEERQTLVGLRLEYITLTNDKKQLEKDYTDTLKKESDDRQKKLDDEEKKQEAIIKSLNDKMLASFKEEMQREAELEQERIKQQETFRQQISDSKMSDQDKELKAVDDLAAKMKAAGMSEVEYAGYIAQQKNAINDKYEQQKYAAIFKGLKDQADMNVIELQNQKAGDDKLYAAKKAALLADHNLRLANGENAKKVEADYNAALIQLNDKRHQDELTKEQQFRQKISDIINQSVQAEQQIMGAAGDLEEARKNRELAAAGGNQAKIEAINKKYFDDSKKLQTATAIINGLVAITKIAAETPKADFGIMTAILIAAQIASTAATVAKIQSTQYTSTSASGGGVGAAAPPTFKTNENIINRQAVAQQQAQKNNNQNNTQAGNPPQPIIKAYVLDHDIALSKERMDKITRLSTH
jgi:hypothetical protein